MFSVYVKNDGSSVFSKDWNVAGEYGTRIMIEDEHQERDGST